MKKIILTTTIFLTISLFTKSQTTRYFEFTTTCGGGNWLDTSFVVATSNQDVIDTVLANISRPLNQRKFIYGNITSGNGGFNHNASHWFLWHFIPSQWKLVYVAIEVCDGCPAGFDTHPKILAGDTLQFCPWTGRPAREVSNPLGVEEYTFENEIILYPNPAKDKLNLKLKSLNNVSVTIYNSSGTESLSFSLSAQNEVIDIASLQAGLYFLKIIDGNKVITKKIIITRN